ncbi:MAG: polyribonucleotide nucleotidyltransferase [Dehalococcoidia bacterium]|nr:polyribonucleotide nucleotidyltransferase [Dehalococcoidia bacterium]MDP6228542.1 polyribonucleotide nucleotidyltransferase [Dehalococcoidia bacterium]MDP7085424.1 polyribonucleotide nucleotidyltransferase [Dehalococcoidia bacterium]MDP7202193.1 polyribonucleotide nucleotidyltransferase [Dehalococcoidia bacterium]MDP7510216.1 polyribonucleotide nucleotidyltransferase [Dehalococcoidia bacterium]
MPIIVERTIGQDKITLETGRLALQAHGSILITQGETVVLATAVMSDKPRAADIDFLPLTVDYEERLYSAGKIPGSFFRREGRPGQEATLAARLTDRSIRPLFPKSLHNDIQITITVLSADQEHPPELLGMIGASAALSMSQIPFAGPIGAARVSYKDGEFTVHPTFQQIAESQLNLVVASTSDAIMMVESGSDEVSEEVVLEGIQRAHAANLLAIDLIEELTNQAGKPKAEVHDDTEEAEAIDRQIKGILDGRLAALLDENTDKVVREEGESRLKQEVVDQLAEQYAPSEISAGFKNVLKEVVRGRVLEHGIRPDGRGLTEIRPISCEVGVLPRTHGSGLFTRGLTQILSTATLGSMSMTQKLDSVGPDGTKRFMHHYNFPSFSTGEARRVGSPSRRDIGHGALAERAILPALPNEEEFPYAIRVVSEAISSNGSTSMGSVCGTTLALLDAGVPMKKNVAGIAMGLITGEDGKFAVLSDIQGVEDFLGDMDFKVAGTADGINALQMDIKLKGLNEDILRQALEQARIGRLHILAKMNEVISEPRSQMSPYAPKMMRLKIPVEKIGALIGPGGRIIRAIIEETGTSIDVQDDGSVTIGGVDAAMMDRARSKVDSLTRELAVGDIFTGHVTRLTSFGAFVELVPGREGLVRSGEMGDMEEEIKVGQEITVMLQEIDFQGRLNLSRRALFGGEEGGESGPRPDSRPPSFDRDRGRGRPGGGFGGGRGGPGGGGRRPSGPGGGPRFGGPRPGGDRPGSR